MIILTNCLTDTADEGCLKVANSLIPRIKQIAPDVTVVSYGKETSACDVCFPVNKLMLSGRLAGFLHSRNEPILYIPAFARMLPTAFRICMLSLYTRGEVWALLAMKSPFSFLSRFLLRLSGAKVIALSDESFGIYREIIGEKAGYLKTGVDTKRCAPVSREQKMALRKKYGVSADKPVVVHVGHMKSGRNVARLAEIDDRFHVLLVISTLTQPEQDIQLRAQLESRTNVTVIDSYLPDIEEIYQLADVYLFPVIDENSCIDVPLSVLEAAACGLPVVTTAYGEIRQLIGREGFYCLDSFEPKDMNDLLFRAVREGKGARESVLAYDWNAAARQLLNDIEGRNEG